MNDDLLRILREIELQASRHKIGTNEREDLMSDLRFVLTKAKEALLLLERRHEEEQWDDEFYGGFESPWGE